MLKKLKNYVKRLIRKIFGPVAQPDRATAFNNGACMWKVEKVISKGDYLYAMENHLGRLLSSNEME